MNSKLGSLTRRRPDFEPGFVAPKQLNLKSLAMQAGLKAVAARGSQKPSFEFICVYTAIGLNIGRSALRIRVLRRR